MVAEQIERRKFYNPFPGDPTSIAFVKGKLFFDKRVLQTESFATGRGFELKWHPEGGGYISICHTEEIDRILWSTAPSIAFICGASGRDRVEESRGSFTVHDTAEIVCSHQTIERIQIAWPQSLKTIPQKPNQSQRGFATEFQSQANMFFQDAFNSNEPDGDGHQVASDGPAVVITGCLYSDPETAAFQLNQCISRGGEELGPFYTNRSAKGRDSRNITELGVRYWLYFCEKRNHHLGFSLKLEQPVMLSKVSLSATRIHVPKSDLPHHAYANSLKVSQSPQPRLWEAIVNDGYNCAMEYLDRTHWLWSVNPLSAFKEIELDRISRLRQPAAAIHALTTIKRHPLKKTLLLPKPKRADDVVNQDLRGVGDSFSFTTTQSVAKFNRVILTYAAEEGERFFGFGEQFSFFDLKGRRVPIMVQEQGLGRGDQPITAAVNLVAARSGGDWHTTYAPVPYYITSKSRCLFLENYSYSIFDLRIRNVTQVQAHSGSLKGRILHGRTPLELIERYTEAIGRMRELPAWILEGAIVGMQGGTQVVRRIWEELRRADVPICAFWLQDWVGQRRTSIGLQLWWNWEVDKEHYADWDRLVQDLQATGIRTMTYLNPFLASTTEKPNRSRDLFEEAKAGGFLVQRRNGSPYMIPNTSFDAAMVDLTNPAACKWLKTIMREMVKTGVKGWMADFGESLPMDAKLSSGEGPRKAHNRYPEMWAKLNREVVEESEGGKEMVFFMRAGYRESPRWATMFWEGDQMVSWQRHDGIKSAVVGLLSGGVSGFSLNHSDIGGYCTVDLPFLRYHRSQELLLRWMELNAFSTLFRSHEGNIPSVNHQLYSSPATIRHFARLAKVYKAWAFYRKQLVKEAAATGLPVVRHMFLHYPEDEQVMDVTYEQFLVGSEIMVVPVLDKGKRYVKPYFPAVADNERWLHIWTGQTYGSTCNQGSKPWVSSPLGYPAVFVKQHSLVGQTFLHNLRDIGVISPFLTKI